MLGVAGQKPACREDRCDDVGGNMDNTCPDNDLRLPELKPEFLDREGVEFVRSDAADSPRSDYLSE
jgi:hypothetical protein